MIPAKAFWCHPLFILAHTGDITVGNEAKEYLTTDPHNTIFSVKRLLGPFV